MEFCWPPMEQLKQSMQQTTELIASNCSTSPALHLWLVLLIWLVLLVLLVLVLIRIKVLVGAQKS